MSDFQITRIINAHTLEVSPFWEMELKGSKTTGNKINIRGFEELPFNETIKDRLEKILLDPKHSITFNAPEIIYPDGVTPIVSCTVYVGRSAINYYFPEYVHK